MKSYLKNNGLSFLILGIAVAFAAWLNPRLPARVPTHFDFRGEPDAYGSKNFSLVFLPLVNLALLVLLPALIRLSPGAYQMENSQRGLARINLAVTFLLSGLYVTILWGSAGNPGPTPVRLALVLAGFMLLLGNYLGKVERNFFAGIRTPWTLASERNWLATHRFSAKLFVATGLAGLATALLGLPAYCTLGMMLAASLVSVAYSFVFYLKHEKQGAKAGSST